MDRYFIHQMVGHPQDELPPNSCSSLVRSAVNSIVLLNYCSKNPSSGYKTAVSHDVVLPQTLRGHHETRILQMYVAFN